ncbi:MAG: ammonium transporter, partial [Nitrospirae bacterium]|nr:ammonium transporter [Nitrospirota bacterium]
MNKLLSILMFAAVMCLSFGVFAEEAQVATPEAAETAPTIDTGDTAWVMISTALVMLMTPGLALFYGGMVRRKNVLGTIMQSFI